MHLVRLTVPEPLDEFIFARIGRNKYTVLSVGPRHALGVRALPVHLRDPFDRLLIAQARLEDIAFVSDDYLVSAYRDVIDVIW